jgi:hypothetical protein
MQVFAVLGVNCRVGWLRDLTVREGSEMTVKAELEK